MTMMCGNDKKRKCRVCGCTDDDCGACVAARGHPCWWVADDLCSRCAGPGEIIRSIINKCKDIHTGWIRYFVKHPEKEDEYRESAGDRRHHEHYNAEYDKALEALEKLEDKSAKDEVLKKFYIEGLEKSEAKIKLLENELEACRKTIHDNCEVVSRILKEQDG